MRWSLLLVPVVLSGCYVGPVFSLVKESKRTCGASFLAWGGGLTYHVLQGPGDGSFDYEPYGSLVERIEGQYDLKNGSLWWRADYADDSFRVRDDVLGYGTLWRDGDMDLTYSLDVTLADGGEETVKVRTQRWGCTETIREDRGDDRVTIRRGEYSNDAFTYTREWIWGPLVVESEGTRAKDGSWEESTDVQEGIYKLVFTEVGDGAGHVRRDFSVEDGRKLNGYWERDRDGSITMDYTSNAPGSKRQSWTYTVSGEGKGGGRWEQDGATCDLKFNNWNCKRRNCSDGTDGECTTPMPWPSQL